jgi:ATP-dependent DNA helicase HFM1/MER3
MTEKFDAVTRRNKDKGSMSFFADIALFMIDEVHILGDERGPAVRKRHFRNALMT